MLAVVPFSYARGGFGVDLPGGAALDTVASGGTADAAWRFENDGDVTEQNSLGFGEQDRHQWCEPKADLINTEWEIRATKNSGTTPSGPALNTWHALTANREWGLTRSTVGSELCSLTIEIRDVATQTIQASAVYTIQAQVTF